MSEPLRPDVLEVLREIRRRRDNTALSNYEVMNHLDILCDEGLMQICDHPDLGTVLNDLVRGSIHMPAVLSHRARAKVKLDIRLAKRAAAEKLAREYQHVPNYGCF